MSPWVWWNPPEFPYNPIFLEIQELPELGQMINTTSTMDGHIEAEGTDINISFAGLGCMIKGVFIRAAIHYLSELSFQNISHQILINKGILPPGPFHGSAHDETVIITNYHSHIEEATRRTPEYRSGTLMAMTHLCLDRQVQTWGVFVWIASGFQFFLPKFVQNTRNSLFFSVVLKKGLKQPLGTHITAL